MAKITIKNKKPRKKVVESSIFSYPYPIQRRYKAAIRKLVDNLTRDSKSMILRMYDKPATEAYFAEDENIGSLGARTIKQARKALSARYAAKAEELTKKMLRETHKSSRQSVGQSFKKFGDEFVIKVPEMPKDMQDVLRAQIEESVGLIKNIEANYFDRVTGNVMRSITTGDGNLSRLTRLIDESRKVALHRAENVALDQTRKAYQAVTRLNLKNAGIKKAIWIHTGGTLHPRKAHQDFDGKEFNIEDGAPIGHYDGRTDAPTWPAFEPFCRCTMKAILDWDDDE